MITIILCLFDCVTDSRFGNCGNCLYHWMQLTKESSRLLFVKSRQMRQTNRGNYTEVN